MVFTCAVPEKHSETRTNPRGSSTPLARVLTRRTTLVGLGAAGLGAVAVTLGACSSGKPGKTIDQAIGTDPIGALYSETINLIAAYDQAIAAAGDLAPALGQLRDEQRQHALAIAGLMGTVKPSISAAPNASGASISPSEAATAKAGKSSPAPGSPVASLSDAEKAAARNAANACTSAPADRVATLAAIAACRSTHVAALGAMR